MSHLALFLPELECGGAQRVMLLLCRAFAARGHQVDLVVAQSRGALIREVPSEVRLVDLEATGGFFGIIGLGISSMRRLEAYLRKERPAALLSTLTGANLVAVAARWSAHVSTRLVLREAVTLKNRCGGVWHWLMRRLYPAADAVVVLTLAMEREVVEILAIPESKVICIPNPVDEEAVRRQAQMAFDEPYSITDRPFILAVGRLTPQKDYATLIRAFAGIATKVDACLVILGEGPQRPELEALVARLDLQGRVLMPGHESNPWRWMRRARLFVLSSRWEGHPNALLEALVLGVPVIATKYDDSIGNIVGGSDRLVPVGAVQEMSEAMGTALLEPPLRSSVDIPRAAEVADSYLHILLPAAEHRR